MKTPARAVAAFTRALFSFAGARTYPLLAIIAGGAVFEGVGLALLVPLLALLADGGSFAAAPWHAGLAAVGADGRLARLTVVLSLFVFVVAIRAWLLALRDRRQATMQIGFVESERARLLAAIGGAGWREISGLRHARVIRALADDLDRTASSAHLILSLTGAAVMLAVQGVVALLIAPTLAAITILLLLVAGAVAIALLSRGWRLGEALAADRLAIVDQTGQMLGGLKAAMAQGLQAEFAGELAATGRTLADRRLELMRRHSISRIASSTAVSVAGATAVFAGVAGGLSTVALIAVLAVMLRMVGPATGILQQLQLLMEYLPGFFSQRSLVGELSGVTQPACPVSGTSSDGDGLRLLGVTYRHAGRGDDGVADIDLAVAAGEMVGITGPSGAGKTTLLDLIAGLVAPDAGEIRIDGLPLTDRVLREWRGTLGYVSQEPYLFNDTLRRNLLFGSRDSAPTQMADALALAGIDDFVASLPAGLDTMVGERGSALSGGQQQRIVLARTLLRRPRLLILDEATSAIDPPGQRAIVQGLRTIVPRPTILIASHDATLIALCDRAFEVVAGRIVPVPDRSSQIGGQPV